MEEKKSERVIWICPNCKGTKIESEFRLQGYAMRNIGKKCMDCGLLDVADVFL
ncbi:hypothetical protein ACT7DI_25355 [Bacillus paranthracis]